MIMTTIDYKKLQDWHPKRLYCYFRLSVVVAIAWSQFLRAGRGRNSQICRWDCYPSYRSSRGISISVLVVIVAVTWQHFTRARHGRKSWTCR